MWTVRVYVIVGLDFFAHALSALQIPLCPTEVLDALRETAREEPLHMAKTSLAHCLADETGKLTLLHEAARLGAYGSIPRLIQQGADPFAIDRRGATPLHWAAARGSNEAIEALLVSLGKEKSAKLLQAADVEGLTPLDHAEVNSRIRAASALVRHRGMRASDVLIEGSCPGAAVDAVLLSKADDLAEVLEESGGFFSTSMGDCVLNSDPREWSLIHLATAVAVLSLAPGKSSVGIVKVLLTQGADATREDAYGQTPLYFATKAGRMDLVQILLDFAPQEVNHADSFDQTPLMYAAMKGREDVAKLLLSKGADADRPDRNSLSARDWAIENGHAEVLKALSAVPRGVRGNSGMAKASPRTDFPGQEVSIMFLILLTAVWLGILVKSIRVRRQRKSCKGESMS